MSAKDPGNLNIFTVALFTVFQMTQCIVLIVQCFYLQRSKGPSVLLSARDKRITITFHENQRLNIRNLYHKDGITEFEAPHNIIPHQIAETLKE